MTNKEREALGQNHYEFRDQSGTLVFDCWRPNMRLARKAYRYAKQMMVLQKKKHQKLKREMTAKLNDRKEYIERMERKKLISQGAISLNEMSLFDFNL